MPGQIFKDVTFEKDADTVIGKYVPGFSQSGKKIIKIESFNKDTSKVIYSVYGGDKEEINERFEAEIEPKMPFYAFTEEALPFVLMF